MSKRIAIGGDHAGFEYKQKLTEKLKAHGYEVKDFGPFSDESVDYPDHVHPLAVAIKNQEIDEGILICGSGNGVAMTANKHTDIRAALCWNSELAALARQHNNANVICIPARFVSYKEAEEMVDTFLSTNFEGGRHERRIKKISC
ncbi:ribose 5-phosphate isomerase B [Xanthovirga aplysinae]|uniref:ribose 5-phosphate isomerase B n=1 Tax=Xanthovirga aplysinae TaxID=2529853 RepID=UPI0012BC84C7|nr:ribose 5-phosphate isomerase B [Xanthovirga aplysinae]MTI30570.1 ribose 5-phosphate isomerase B [Xanthovirga aplysinae]